MLLLFFVPRRTPPLQNLHPQSVFHSTMATTYEPEKMAVDHNEDLKSPSSHDDYECEFSEREQRKIIHRIDRRLVVTVGVLYCISLMDRTNLSAAAIAG